MFSDSILNFILSFFEIVGIFILWSKFNENNKNSIIKYGLLAIIISVINNTLVYVNLEYLFIINYLLIIILISIAFKKSLQNAVIEFVIVIVITMVLQILFLTIMNFLSDHLNIFVFNIEEFRVLFINFLMLIPIIVIRYMIPYNNIDTNNINMQIVFFYFVSAFVYIFVIKTIWEIDYKIIEENIVVFMGILIVYIAANIKFLRALIFLIEEKKNLEAYNRYSKLTIDLVNDVKSKQHDFKNHLSTIYGIVQVSGEGDSREKIKEYIEGLNISLSKEQNIIALENKVLAGIIYSKLQRAEEMNIKFSYSINSDLNMLPIKDYELSEILFNLLDNAFDAVYKQEDSRWVSLVIDKNKENSIIRVTNSGATLKNTNISDIFKKGFSTKGSQRGFGLYNIKSIVDKYNGSIEIATENNVTEFVLFFN